MEKTATESFTLGEKKGDILVFEKKQNVPFFTQPVVARIEALVKKFDAYLARSNIGGTPGVPRSGHWTIRVPADRYDAFLSAARELGEVRRISSDSQDVTEEFYDVEARIRNKQQEESRLLKLLETATGKLEEVLAVEREISRVRGEVEQLQGRVRVLSDLVALATVELVVTEIRDYVPEEAATYATRVRRSFQASINALLVTGDQLSIAAVVLSPWLAVLLVLGLPLVLGLRAWRKRRRSFTLGEKKGDILVLDKKQNVPPFFPFFPSFFPLPLTSGRWKRSAACDY